MRRRKLVIIAICFGAFCLVGMQFARPALKDPPHARLLQGAVVPRDVAQVFERACQDCHSNNTLWPWYARVAPVSLVVAEDVNRGRKFLNLSQWQMYTKGQKLGYLSSMALATANRKMPPRMYSAMHPDARLTDEERKLIATWAQQERARVRAGSQ